MLRLEGIHVSIATKHILQGVSLQVNEGEIVALIGHNGAGKSTTLETIVGIRRPDSGTISFNGELISNKQTTEIVEKGICLVPQSNNVFANLSVEENLELGAEAVKGKSKFSKSDILDIFPILAERKKQLVGTMSGGQRQMVALGIGLMSNPRYLLLDEPSVGIQPNLVDKIMEQIVTVNQQFGISIIVVEQNINKVLEIANRTYVMSRGTVIKGFSLGEVNSEELWHLM
jgi:ABC-type branched-subunit amino acid transport system ATPase component